MIDHKTLSLGFLLSTLVLATVTCTAAAEPPLPQAVDFNRDIRPILSENCFFCHGPDKNHRKADLRLDTKEGIFSGEEDHHPVVAGKPEESEVYRRIISTEKSEKMPRPGSGKELTERQIALVRKWIEQGAVYKGHWAYVKPVRPTVPEADLANFVRTPVDRFILARLNESNLKPSSEADRITLIRRLYFDLTGLPPTKAEVDAFLTDTRPDAYEQLVDRLFASPHFGERMAMYWLDLVRYADSIGYHSDNPMNVSPYRDYVIRAFNDNKRFDQFTIEQLAGDLLPQPTMEQKVASGYNRLLQTTEEGGAQPKEYAAKYAADRVRNVSSVWMGSTMGCVQCHDHKFDPFSIKDFYSMAAFFADIKEASVGRREAGMFMPSDEQAADLKRLDDEIAEGRKKMEAGIPDIDAAVAEWEKHQAVSIDWKILAPKSIETSAGTQLLKQGDGVILVGKPIAERDTFTITTISDLKGISAFRLEVLTDPTLPFAGPGASPNGNFVLTEFKVAAAEGENPSKPVKLSKATADFSQSEYPVSSAIDNKAGTGWAILPEVGKPHSAVFQAAHPLGGDHGVTLTFTLAHQSIFPKHSIGKFRLSATNKANTSNALELPPAVRTILAVPVKDRKEQQKKELATYYRSVAPELAPVRAQMANLERRKTDLVEAIPKVLITMAEKPKVVRVLARGNWLDDSGEIMQPAVPHSLPQLDVKNRRANRLDLARWLVARDNPLTARVMVNRMWKLYFGQGLSKILDDVGSQGEWPTHPEMLDWLAVEFMDSGWDVKHMVKLLVTSGTYRQTSRTTPELKERDPFNRLYARQSRWRLDAELVRDNALAISDLLVLKVGGPSVKPYQPAGYWSALNFPPREWQTDTGERIYRRGMYTHWQRTYLQPSMVAFDAPSREECTVERTRSNIPQQALALLNDPTYVEASRVFAERIIKEGGASPGDRLTWAYGCALSRAPRADEMRVLTALFEKHAREYGEDKEAAKKLTGIGQRPAPKDIEVSELAAWTSVARVIMNLHETITRD